jgi:uncharacterized NAD(P)/FAD-binding protein YdhS
MPDRSAKMKRIVVVGGGAAGVWQAAALSARGVAELDIVEPSAVLGRGLAYSATNPDHLLNVTPDKMDSYAVPGFESFTAWLSRRDLFNMAGYYPRALFGDYMEDVVRQIRTRTVLRHRRAKVTDIVREEAGFSVKLDASAPLFADHVVLALGNLPPRQIAPSLCHLCVIEDPWHMRPADIAGARRVVVAGTGLTAIDAATTVISVEPAAHLTFAANHPFIPPADALTEPWVGAESVVAARPSQVWREVMGEIRRSDGNEWIGVMEAMKSQTPRIWDAWTLQERAIFVRHGLRHWLHHRHRTPPQSHDLIDRLTTAGQLDIVHGRVANIVPDTHGVRMTIGEIEATADVVINATGPSVDLDDDPLLAAARARGLVAPDPLGLGLAVTQEGQALAADGRPVPGLWILGAWTRGTHFEVVAVPLLRKHAAGIVEAIAATN